jgi:hypothetical protein
MSSRLLLELERYGVTEIFSVGRSPTADPAKVSRVPDETSVFGEVNSFCD